MHILHVVGARPNFMKFAPVHRALSARPGVIQTVVHTGQHYDVNMSDVFFSQLQAPDPDVNLGVGSGTHARQTAEVMIGLEPVLEERNPDMVLVYGDINSTVAAAMVCAKLGVPTSHVEAGLRSFDRSMPEEINRIVTDRLADLLLTPSEDADENLRREGVDESRIKFVGNVMIDSLTSALPAVEAAARASGRTPGSYAAVTVHRPANVDQMDDLQLLMRCLSEVSELLPVHFPIHPRTRARMTEFGIESPPGVQLLDPLGYVEFLALEKDAAVVITDSGGVQEETTFLGVPCLTIRPNTERPVTVELGTNTLVNLDPEKMRTAVMAVKAGRGKKGSTPPKWDGHAAERIADIVTSWDG